MRKEEWKQCVDFPLYEVSNTGKVRSLRTGWPLRPNKALSVVLRKDGKSHSVKLSRLILTAFVRPPKSTKELARHLDDNKKNNMLSNLAWGSHKDNYDDGVRNGRNGAGTLGAKIRGDKLRGLKRPINVRNQISATKQAHPERQFYGMVRDPHNGRFTGCTK